MNKVTYSLKPETVSRVEELSAKWGVPKSEVIRRVVDRVAVEEAAVKKETPLEILLRLQESDGISAKTAAKFNVEVRRVRQASGRKRG